jgi:hypothetical protein
VLFMSLVPVVVTPVFMRMFVFVTHRIPPRSAWCRRHRS